jgi:3-hydroxyacyl-CoA dehydrogenase/enoyl-CoA hydratase/3-hydroxybutyryl-CoA epimerase
MEQLFSGKAFKLEVDGDLAIVSFDLEGERVNKIGFGAASDLDQILGLIKTRGSKALLIRSLKKGSFVVGADINLIQGLKGEEDARQASSRGQALFSKLEDLGIPSIVAIDGPCVGGGCEMSLACTYRICSDSDKTKIGLPEINLGILPGWGGCYRLPKQIGLMNSLDVILAGKTLNAKKCLKVGLVDMVVPAAILQDKALEIARGLAKGEKPKGFKTPVVDLKTKLLESNFVGRRVIFSQAKSGVLSKTRGHYPAPLKALQIIQDTWGQSRDRVLQAEAKAFAELWATSESKNLVNLFFMMEDAKKNTGCSMSDEQVKKLPEIGELGVLGAGVMGGGIAAQSSTFGFRTTVKDINFDANIKALTHARELFDKMVKRKRITALEREKRLSMIRTQIDFHHFEALDLVIEAIVENMDVKKKVFAELESKVSSKCILASNTSSLRLTEMSKALKDPTRFVGIHFFNPVDKMPLVEVITHEKTSVEVVARTVAWVKAIGKTPVVVKDGPGFLVNRLLMPWLNECAYLLLEGFEIPTLDAAAKKFGMPMGPCELLDEIGIDVASKVSHILQSDFGDRAQAASTSDKILAANKAGETARLGRKSGLGFYKWDRPGGKRLEADRDAINQILFNGSKPSEPEHTYESLTRRMFFPMINEAAMVLDEGIAASPSDVDLAMIFGTGFPPFRGGLCRFADTIGLKKIEAELERMSAMLGARMIPSAALRSRAAATGRFYDV